MNDLDKILRKVTQDGILELVGDSISIQDTSLRILYQNVIHKKLLGEHLGDYCYKAYKNEIDACEDCPLVNTFKDGQIHTAQRKVIINNKPKYFETTSSPLKNSDGKIIAGIEVVRDITERNKMADEIKNKVKELEKFYDMAIGREIKMKQLKDEIKNLKSNLSKHMADSKK